MARISAALVEWKAAKDLDTAARLLSSFPRLPFGERVFVYAPLDAAPVYPDLVLRVVRPADAVQWLRALGAATAERAEGRSGGVGALCGECTAFPLVTGRAAVSPGCPGSRREAFLAPDEILLSLPLFPRPRGEPLLSPRGRASRVSPYGPEPAEGDPLSFAPPPSDAVSDSAETLGTRRGRSMRRATPMRTAATAKVA